MMALSRGAHVELAWVPSPGSFLCISRAWQSPSTAEPPPCKPRQQARASPYGRELLLSDRLIYSIGAPAIVPLPVYTPNLGVLRFPVESVERISRSPPKGQRSCRRLFHRCA